MYVHAQYIVMLHRLEVGNDRVCIHASFNLALASYHTDHELLTQDSSALNVVELRERGGEIGRGKKRGAKMCVFTWGVFMRA